MNTISLFTMLDGTLPDEQIIRDLSNKIWQEKELGGTYIELSNKQQFVPDNARLDIVTKALFKEYYDIGFGTYKIMVAIGGIQSQKHGMLTAKYCFATLYYNEYCKLFTVDFHEEIR